jgi:hypothetical protein
VERQRPRDRIGRWVAAGEAEVTARANVIASEKLQFDVINR